MIIVKRKSKYKNQIEKKQGERISKAKYQRKYYWRVIKPAREKERLKQISFDDKYRTNLFNGVKHLVFGHCVTLRFNRFVNVEYAQKSAKYFCDYLTKYAVTNNQIYVVEFGSSKHIHIHLAFNFNKSFLELYKTLEEIEAYLYGIWNNDKVKNGTVWVGGFKVDREKVDYLKYIFKEIFPSSSYNVKQKQVDAWFVQSYHDSPNVHEGIKLDYLNQILRNASIEQIEESLDDFKIYKLAFRGKELIKPNEAFRYIAVKHKSKLVFCFLAAVVLLFV